MSKTILKIEIDVEQYKKSKFDPSIIKETIDHGIKHNSEKRLIIEFFTGPMQDAKLNKPLKQQKK